VGLTVDDLLDDLFVVVFPESFSSCMVWTSSDDLDEVELEELLVLLLDEDGSRGWMMTDLLVRLG
jgi:hypothetical protein